MTDIKGPTSISGDLEVDLALHEYLNSASYREFDASRTPAAREKLEQSEAHKTYRRVIDAYLLRQMRDLNRRR